jgi:hypothetical protein
VFVATTLFLFTTAPFLAALFFFASAFPLPAVTAIAFPISTGTNDNPAGVGLGF